ncbi:MAG: DUF308 domain-containing protein [Acidimicrobiia bacterium]|nr:DUF308 domain-containing protein [Acidimicrobiia bacterium]
MTGIDMYVDQDMKRYWWVLLVFGLLSIVIGGLLIFWPGQTLTVVTTIVGLFMIIVGVMRFFMAIFGSAVENRWLLALVGIVGVVIGVIVIRNPETTIKVIVLITAIFWLVLGMVDFFRGLTDPDLPDRGLRIGFGALTALFGVVLLVWPDVTVTVFAILVGIYIVIMGIFEVLAAFQLKNATPIEP